MAWLLLCSIKCHYHRPSAAFNLKINMKNHYVLLLVFLASALTSWSQVKYSQPADIIGEGYRIIISDIESEKDNTTFKAEFFNTSRTEYLSIDPSKLGVEFEGLGTYYFNSKIAAINSEHFVIEPGDKKSKTIKVVGDFEHKVESVTIKIDGLSQGAKPSESISLEDFKLSDGFSGDLNADDFQIEFKKVSAGKNGLVAKGELSIPEVPATNYIILLNRSAITCTDANGGTVNLEVSAMSDQPVDLDTDKDLTFKTSSPVESINVIWGEAFKKIELTSLTVEGVEVRDEKAKKPVAVIEEPVAETPEPSKPVESKPIPTFEVCDPIVNDSRSGDVTVRIISEVGCFKLYSQGELINSEFTSSLTFKGSAGFLSMKVVMSSGDVIEKKVAIGEDYKVAFYNIKEKKGKYSLKLSLGNSQPIDEPVAEVKLSDTSFGADEITCKDKMLRWGKNTYDTKITVVRVTRTEIVYVHCAAPDEVLRVSKKDVSVIDFADGSEFWISHVRYPSGGNIEDKTLTRNETYERHVKKD